MAKSAEDLNWAVEGPPIGVWVTSNGTFDNMMQDRLSLRPDGTGYLYSRSVLRGEETFPVMWQQHEPGVLKIDMLFPDDDPERPNEWETVRYVAAMKANDVGGSVPVLKNADADIFWTLVGPIELRSKTPD
ncbi:MAG: hypothetical protein AAF543_19950 [Pseudomonadota bacterium]